MAGFRYVDFHEGLQLNNNVRMFLPPGLPLTPGDQTGSLSTDLAYSTVDSIRTFNHFYGVQVGIDSLTEYGRFFLQARGKLAIGLMNEVVNINSQTTVINNDLLHPNPTPGVSPGGLLTSPLDPPAYPFRSR